MIINFKVLKNKELLFSLIIKLLQLASSLILMKLLSSKLSKIEFGYYSLVMAIGALINMLPFSALNQGVLRFSAEYKYDTRNFFLNILMIYSFFLTIYIALIILILELTELSSKWINIVNILPFFVVSSVFFTLLTWYENSLKNQEIFAYMLFLDLSIKSFGILLLSNHKLLNIESVTVLFSCSYGLLFFIFISLNRRLELKGISVYESKKLFRLMAPYVYPIMIWNVFVWAQGMVARWYLEVFASTSDVASFSIISAMSILPATAITGVLGTYLLPKLFHQYAIQRENIFIYITKGLRIIIMIMLFMLAIFLGFKETIVAILTDRKYVDAAWMLPYMFSVMIVYAIGNLLSYVALVEKETKKLIVSNVMPGVFAIVIGFFLIKYYGLMGAFFTFLGTYALSGVLNTYIIISRYDHKRT